MGRNNNLIHAIAGFFTSNLTFLGIVTCYGLPIIVGMPAWSGLVPLL